MEPSESLNPYAPPSAAIEPVAGATTDDAAPLADRGARLGAAMLDWLLCWLPAMIAGAIAAVMFFRIFQAHIPVDSARPRVDPDLFLQEMTVPLLLWGAGLLGALGVAIYQCYLITTTGQSIAKRWLQIKIVNLDGTPVTFGSGVGVRGILIQFLTWVPYLGVVFALVDVLFIFRDDRRCLHDLMAGTKVISVPRD